jgi:hypothetical protein
MVMNAENSVHVAAGRSAALSDLNPTSKSGINAPPKAAIAQRTGNSCPGTEPGSLRFLEQPAHAARRVPGRFLWKSIPSF